MNETTREILAKGLLWEEESLVHLRERLEATEVAATRLRDDLAEQERRVTELREALADERRIEVATA